MNTNDHRLCELTPDEAEGTQGGIWMNVTAALLIAAGASIINNWDGFKAGLMGLPDPVRASKLL